MLRRQQHLPNSATPVTAPAGNGPPGLRSGFTLVEMMVAVVILAVGLLALVSTSGYVARQVGGGAQQGIAASVIQSRVETLRSIPCDSIKTGNAVTRRVTERWTKGAKANNVLTVVDTVQYTLNGSKAGANYSGTTTRVYTIMVPCW